ncbi:MAG TPA: RagB/SusD family nutrient uptake outer membrane protein [Chitinophagaceae bacterium]|nr:RagB/SusD family nutrient uptake outer membrane protein [Chitinophagaceae bacterium]
MIKNRRYLILLLAFAGLASCKKDLLDKLPADRLSDNIVWTDPNAAEQFINGIYGQIISGFDRPESEWGSGTYLLDGASDDGDVTFEWSESQALHLGAYNPSNSPLAPQWSNFYAQVRRTNLALANLDRVEGNDDKKLRLKGEAYFLRAYTYHDLLRFYGSKQAGNEGGIPLLATPLTPSDDFQIPRSSYDESVNFIIKDLDSAAAILPGVGGIEAGRASKGAALALKSRVLLYAERWAEAAAAAKEVMELTPGYMLFPDYETLFLTENNSEIIFAKKFTAPVRVHGMGFSWAGYTAGNFGFETVNLPAGSFGGWGGTTPTQNLVDAYEMKDGKSITQSPLYSDNDPYRDRDPRFYATVLYNGSVFGGKTVETFEGGANSKSVSDDASNTGYYIRKYLNPSMEKMTQLYPNTSDQDWIYIRYAEVLLNYAEAQNEAVGPDATVYDAINQVRSRPSVNQPPLQAGLSQADMRMQIRNERRVELSFEEHRYFDIRRWGIAKDVLNGPMYGMKITQNGNAFTYERIVFEERVFLDKMVVLPIPQSEIDKNPAAKQIAGW